ncbi:MAG: pantoate--beta-alanine ligase [Gemmatimonadota bacterium]|nr:MAG: pantoate--beta-alanine ligase [Gemmatimonadota bacterium]
MKLVKTISEVRAEVGRARSSGRSIGLVPTMGFLHEGHLSLADRCCELAGYVVMSIYVNPLQFGPSEDFDEYPRALERDLALAEERGVDLVFAPADRELYPTELTVTVAPRRLADRLCGLSRPGHFEGVLTVVGKLFGIVQPDLAVFGQKDFQQAVLIQKMVIDLDMPVRVEVAPTVREADGIAMSSRNEYLSADERRRALSISRGLAGALRSFRSGERDAAMIGRGVLQTMEEAGGVDVEYVEVVSADDLEPVQQADEETVVVVAARVGTTRLIDNARLGAPDPGLARLL